MAKKNTSMNTNKYYESSNASQRNATVIEVSETFRFAGGSRSILHEFIYLHKIRLWQICPCSSRSSRLNSAIRLSVIRNVTKELVMSGQCEIGSSFSLHREKDMYIVFNYIHISFGTCFLPRIALNLIY